MNFIRENKLHFILWVLMLAVFLVLRYTRERGPALPPAEQRAFTQCVEKAYYENYKAFVDDILQGRYDLEAKPLREYGDVQAVHAALLRRTEAQVVKEGLCGKRRVTDLHVARAVSAYRTRDVNFQRGKDTICLAVYMRQGINPCGK